MTTTTDWPTGSSDHAASNVKTATVIQFVPRANPNRGNLLPADFGMSEAEFEREMELAQGLNQVMPELLIGHPWSGEDKA